MYIKSVKILIFLFNYILLKYTYWLQWIWYGAIKQGIYLPSGNILLITEKSSGCITVSVVLWMKINTTTTFYFVYQVLINLISYLVE